MRVSSACPVSRLVFSLRDVLTGPLTCHPQFMLSVGKLCEFAQTVELDSHPLPGDAFIGAFHSANVSIA